MKKLIVLVVLLSACTITNESPDALIVSDGSIDVMELDTMVLESTVPDVKVPDMKVPDLGEYKCSPAGYYTFNVSVTENTCPSTIVKKMEWTNSAFMKSYYCILYFEDGYSFLDNDKLLYCAYYTEPKPTGIKQWAECVVYNSDKTTFCEFKFSAPFTEPK